MESLTICIPTFNRPESLRSLLQILLPLASHDEVKVLIIDNASPIPATQVVEEFPEFSACVEIIRNPVNIGGNANLCRCFELCNSEWMWLLGDDDLPTPESLNLILAAIDNSTPECCMINWRSGIYPEGVERQIHCMEDIENLCDDQLRFSNFLFISSSVYRIPLLHPFLKEGYHFSFTCAPHLIMPFLAVADGASIRDINQFLVHYGPPQTGHEWNTLYYLLGVCALADYQPLRGFSHTVVRSAVMAMRGKLLKICKMLLKAAFSCPRKELAFWSSVSIRLAASATPIDALVLLFLGTGIRHLWIIEPLRSLISSSKNLRPNIDNQSRT
jgi:glycosyltransferase involved in cell wall biosynthesis